MVRDGKRKYNISISADKVNDRDIFICGESIDYDVNEYGWINLKYILPMNVTEFTLEIKNTQNEIPVTPDDPTTPNEPATSDNPTTPNEPTTPNNPITPNIPIISSIPEVPTAQTENTRTQSGKADNNNNSQGTISKSAPTASAAARSVRRTKTETVSYNAQKAGFTGEILKEFSENAKAKILIANFGSLSVKVKKSDITDTKVLLGAKFTVSDSKFISDSNIKKLISLKDSEKVIQISFKGSFSMNGIEKIGITADVGKKFAGREITVYEIKNNKLVKAGSGRVNENGIVSLSTDHIARFVIAVK